MGLRGDLFMYVNGEPWNVEHEQVDCGSPVECELVFEQRVLTKLGEQVEKPINLVERLRRELPHKRVIHDSTSSSFELLFSQIDTYGTFA